MSEKDNPEPINEVQPNTESQAAAASTFNVVSAADMEKFTAASRTATSTGTGSSDTSSLTITDPFKNSLSLTSDGTSGGPSGSSPEQQRSGDGPAPPNGPPAETVTKGIEDAKKSAAETLAAFQSMGVGKNQGDGQGGLSGAASESLFDAVRLATDELQSIDAANQAADESNDSDSDGETDEKDSDDNNDGILDINDLNKDNVDDREALKQSELAKARTLDPDAKNTEYEEGVERKQKTDRIAATTSTTSAEATSATPVAESQVAAGKFETTKQIGETKPDGQPAHDNGKLLSSQNQLELAMNRLREAASRPGSRAGSDGGNGPSVAA